MDEPRASRSTGRPEPPAWRNESGPTANMPQVVFVPLSDAEPGRLLNDGLAAPTAVGAAAVPPPFTAAPVPESAIARVAPAPVRPVVDLDVPAASSHGSRSTRGRRRHPASRSRVAAATLSGTAAVGLVVLLASGNNGTTVASASGDTPTGLTKSSTSTSGPATSAAPIGDPTAGVATQPTDSTAVPVTDPTATPVTDPLAPRTTAAGAASGSPSVRAGSPGASPAPAGGTAPASGGAAPASGVVAAAPAPTAPAPAPTAPVTSPPPPPTPTTTAPPPPPEEEVPPCTPSTC